MTCLQPIPERGRDESSFEGCCLAPPQQRLIIVPLRCRRVVLVTNLKPANMRGIKSQAMVLCATSADGNKVEIVTPPEVRLVLLLQPFFHLCLPAAPLAELGSHGNRTSSEDGDLPWYHTWLYCAGCCSGRACDV